MLFPTREFLVFAIMLVAALAVVRGDRPRKMVLLAASYVFYAAWNAAFVALLAFSTSLDYLVGLGLGRSSDPGRRRLLLTTSVVTQLSVLAWFKYAGFFARTSLWGLRLLGFHPHWGIPNVVLPIGISFYTFQTLSYTIDVYRRKLEPTRSPLDFALFIALFPHLVAGPIIKASTFLPQLDRRMRLSFDRYGMFLILRGLTKKVLVADNVARLPDVVFVAPNAYGSVVIWLAVVAFGVQIYCDFSGYSDMAIGMLRILGFDVPVNFDRPYFAANPADFWRRWHISLSTWLRDYLYIPLGGSRRGRLRTYRNVMLTMLIGGLWHGAAWNFVLWGGLHGLLLAGYRALRPHLRTPSPSLIRRGARIVAMQYFVLLTWIPFRVRDPGNMVATLRKFILFDFRLDITNRGLGHAGLFFASTVIAMFWVAHAYSYARDGLDRQLTAARPAARVAVCVAAGLLLVWFWPLHQAPFIYYQF